MWIGAYEHEGRTDFFAITSDKASLGPFRTFEQAQAALAAYEEKTNRDMADRVGSLIPLHVHRQTRLGKNGVGHWVIRDTFPGFLIFQYNNEHIGEGYLVFVELGFVLVDAYPDLSTAEAAAAKAAEYKI